MAQRFRSGTCPVLPSKQNFAVCRVWPSLAVACCCLNMAKHRAVHNRPGDDDAASAVTPTSSAWPCLIPVRCRTSRGHVTHVDRRCAFCSRRIGAGRLQAPPATTTSTGGGGGGCSFQKSKQNCHTENATYHPDAVAARAAKADPDRVDDPHELAAGTGFRVSEPSIRVAYPSRLSESSSSGARASRRGLAAAADADPL